MTAFTLAATALLLTTLFLLLAPLWLECRSESSERATRYALHASTLAELDAELAAGRLSETDHAEARREADARLVHELAQADVEPDQAPLPRWLTLLVALVIAGGSGALYLHLGSPAALNPMARKAPAGGEPDIAGMVRQLEAKLALNADNPEGWAMLARSYRTMARYKEAVEAYEQAWPAIKDNPGEIARMAGSMAIVNTSFAGKPATLLARALELNPKEPDALMLAGSAAVERGDFDMARHWWRTLLEELEPGSEDAVWLEGELATLAERKPQ
ncbi:c-type cytochrome biogenesis protein CcmI [Chitinibacteraceae bacterium HSL-7]